MKYKRSKTTHEIFKQMTLITSICVQNAKSDKPLFSPNIQHPQTHNN